MTAPSPVKDGLSVRRADLASALRIVSGTMGRRASGASLRFEDGWLIVAAGGTLAKAPASGCWPVTIIVGSSWVRRLARSLPPGDPVVLHVENGRLFANRYSEVCQPTSVENPLLPSLGTEDESRRRILEAAAILKPFLVGSDELRSLIETASHGDSPAWREEEKTMISAVARAWAVLAPLGVETADLRALINRAVRTAWKPEDR